jgi:hypothetical protein
MSYSYNNSSYVPKKFSDEIINPMISNFNNNANSNENINNKKRNY